MSYYMFVFGWIFLSVVIFGFARSNPIQRITVAPIGMLIAGAAIMVNGALELARDKGTLYPWNLLVISAVAVVFVLREFVHGYQVHFASASWPRAEALILESDFIKRLGRRGRPAYEVTLHYSYFAEGVKRYGKAEYWLRSQAAAEEFVATATGATLTVRVNPKHPDWSVLPLDYS